MKIEYFQHAKKLQNNFLHREMQIISRAEKQEFLLHRKSRFPCAKTKKSIAFLVQKTQGFSWNPEDFLA